MRIMFILVTIRLNFSCTTKRDIMARNKKPNMHIDPISLIVLLILVLGIIALFTDGGSNGR
jgi:hypothetical protein